VIWSASTQKGKQGSDLGRMSALLAGYDVKASGMTLDRFCGGGITSVNLAAAQVISGFAECVVAGGCEMMSYTAAAAAEEMAAGLKPLGIGGGNPELARIHPQSHQGVCGDAIAAMEAITRARMSTRWGWRANAAPPPPSPRAASPRASYR
jgi:acetyl-CoA C-acetyltransferase